MQLINNKNMCLNITLNQNGTNCTYNMGIFFGQNKPGGVTPPVISNIKYGRLYNWYAASNPLFVPIGWHVPTAAEFETLITFLGGASVAGGKLKETGLVYWNSPNEGATNEVGFNFRGAGQRDQLGSFEGQDPKIIGEVFSITEFDVISSYYYYTDTITTNFYESQTEKVWGIPIRLVKDDSINPLSLTDLDGNVYRTTKIGDQVWLADNWASTKLNNGTPIPNVTDDVAWAALTTGAYCNYNNDIANVFLT